MKVPGVINCYNIASRGLLGQQIFIEMKIIVSTSKIKYANQISQKVKAAIKKYFNKAQILIQVEQSDEGNKNISDNLPLV